MSNTVAASPVGVAMSSHIERMVPELSDRFTFWEHVYRYAFACRFVAGKRVLDIACGDGYGTAALAKAGAASVTGIDVSVETCEQARTKYGIDTRPGNAEDIPLADGSVDVVVSFETIEHVSNPERFLQQCVRVLARPGILIVSTPNKDIYSRAGSEPNPYHCSEMTENEFVSALGVMFRNIRLYTQRPRSAGWWSLRVWSSEVTPNVRGWARIRRDGQQRFFARALNDPTNEERRFVVSEILKASRKGTNLLNPFAVRPRRKWTAELPVYFVAVVSNSGGTAQK